MELAGCIMTLLSPSSGADVTSNIIPCAHKSNRTQFSFVRYEQMKEP